jgi:Ca2+-dependent lipid-binding protein
MPLGAFPFPLAHSASLPKVELIKCENLASVDWNGRSDPFVRMTTDAKHWSESSVKPATLNPVYGESFWHLVQVRSPE